MRKLLMVVIVGVMLGGSVFTGSAEARHEDRYQRYIDRVCQRIENRIDKRFDKFNQDKRWTVRSVQWWVNAQNRLDCADEDTIVDTLVEAGQFESLIAAVGVAGLGETLANPDAEFTLFAPTDQAFAKLPPAVVDGLLNDPEQRSTLTDILLYHVIDGEVTAKTAKSLSTATMFNGSDVEISVQRGKLFINDSQVVIKNLQASNGIIHVIDTVLLP